MLQPLYIIYMDMTGVGRFSHSVNCPPQIFVTGRALKTRVEKMPAFLKAFLKYCKSFLHLADNTGIFMEASSGAQPWPGDSTDSSTVRERPPGP